VRAITDEACHFVVLARTRNIAVPTQLVSASLREGALSDGTVALDRCEHTQHDAGIARVFDLPLLPHTDRPYVSAADAAAFTSLNVKHRNSSGFPVAQQASS